MTAGSRLKWCWFLLLTIGVVEMVKREDFKTCEQSTFCKRHRSIMEPTGYEILPATISNSGSQWTAVLENDKNKLKLKIIGLNDSSVRVQIDETDNAIRKRYVPNPALAEIPEELGFSKVENQENESTIVSGDKRWTIIVNYKPFVINLFNENGELVTQVNREGKLNVEEFRKKEEGKEYPEGFWEENFKSFRDSKPFGSSSVGVDISFVSFKNAYGLPEHADSFALRNTAGNTDPYRMYNLDVFEYELNNPMALYVAIPYILAHRANASVGALWLNAAETWIDTQSSVTSRGVFGKMIDKFTGTENIPHFDAHFISESGLIDIFLFAGPSIRDVQRQNAKITGVTPLPPIFSIAYHQCRWNYNDEQDVAKVNQGFEDHDIPMDVIWLDIEHTDGKKYFTWDKHKFSTPKDMIDKVAATGRKIVAIIDPHIKKDDSYYVYKDAKDKGLFVKRADGTTDFEGHCWPGASEYLDFWHPETRAYWKDQFAFDRYVGSTPELFVWNDMNEPSVFSGPEITMDKDSIHYGGIEHREVHNMYGMMYHSATFDGLLARTNGRDRPFILSRSGFIGTQRTAAIWTGDNKADWSHLEISAPMLLSLSIAGVPFVGADVGGFFGNPDEQLLTRWYQAGAYQPFFRAHAHIDTKRREPWLFSQETTNNIREAIRARYALLPYWYTLFQQHTDGGMPPMRPLFYEFENDDSLLEEQKHWMVGDGLLVRPVLEKDTYNVQVLLPRGEQNIERWYEWVSGIERKPSVAYVDVPISHTPVFQRGGTIIPTWQRIRRSAILMKDDPLTLFVALNYYGNATGTVYLDDCQTHDYQNNLFIKSEFSYRTISNEKATIEGRHVDGKYEAKNWIERIVVRGVPNPPQNVEITRVSDPTASLEFSYDRDTQVLIIRKPESVITNNFQIHIQF